MPEELREQVPLIKEMLTAMGVNVVTKEGYEADDILGTLARKSEAAGIDATILRLLVVLFTLAGGSGVLFYIVAALIMPDEPEYY